MKFLMSFLALILTFGLSQLSFAAEGGGESHHPDMNALFPPKQPDATRVTGLAKPKLVEPAFLAAISSDSTVLKWEAVQGADQYKVQVATDANFKWLKAEGNFIKETSFNATGLEKGQRYYWRVWAQKSTNDNGYMTSLSSSSAFEAK